MNALDVYGSLLTKNYNNLSYHRIEVITEETVNNKTFTYRKSFYLRVVKPEGSTPVSPKPTSSAYKSGWVVTEMIVRDEISSDKPIPQVLDLDAMGRMTIGWSRDMLPPKDVPIIEKIKIKAYAQPSSDRRALQKGQLLNNKINRTVTVNVSEDVLEQLNSRYFDLDAIEVKILNLVGETRTDLKPKWKVLAYES